MLAAGHSPHDHSAYLLDFARSAIREGRRIRNVGMAMPGGMLRSRLCKILDGISIPTVSRSRAVCAIALCAMSSALLGAATLTSAGPTNQQRDVAPTNLAFEVATVKINKSGSLRAPSTIRPGGRFTATNNTLRDLILNAYDISEFARSPAGRTRMDRRVC